MADARKSPLKWGICGAGKISSDFCNCLISLPDRHQVIAVAANQSLDRAREFATRFSAPKAYGTYEELANDSEVEIVYVGTINSLHYQCCELMLDAGKHVLVEKPFTTSAKLTRQLIEKSQEKKLFLMEGLWSRCFPAVKKFKELIDSGIIGEVRLFRASLGKMSSTRKERMYNKDLGGGVTFDLGIYTIAMCSLVFGQSRPDCVKACGYCTDTGIDEFAAVTVTYPGKKVGQLSCCINLNTKNEAIAIGEKGTLTISAPFWCPTQLITPSGEELNFPLPEIESKPLHFTNSQGLLYEAECVRECIEQGKTECDLMPLKESLYISETIDSILYQLGLNT